MSVKRNMRIFRRLAGYSVLEVVCGSPILVDECHFCYHRKGHELSPACLKRCDGQKFRDRCSPPGLVVVGRETEC